MRNEFYPYTGHYATIQGQQMHYLDEGKGSPVLMVHGNPSWSIYYHPLVEELKKDHRVIVPDHIGCGLSDKPSDSAYQYTLGQRIDDLDALMEQLDIQEPITLIVHDWGGAIGLGYALRHVKRIKNIVLFNTAAFHIPAKGWLPWQLYFTRSPLGALCVRGFNMFSRGAAWVGCTRERMPKKQRNAYCAPYNSWKNRIATLRFVEDIPLAKSDPAYDVVTSIEEGLHNLAHLPVMICWGAKDPVFHKKFLMEWGRFFPEAQVHFFEDCGHYILEDAKEEVVPLVRKFMEKNACPTTSPQP